LPHCSLPFAAPTFNEFVVETDAPAAVVLQRLAGERILAGLDLQRYYPQMANRLLVCVTEQNSRAQIDTLVAALAGGAA